MAKKLLMRLAVFGFLLVHCCVYAYAVDGLRVYDPQLLQYVKDYMPKTGTLKKNNNGYVYVEVDNKYVTAVLQQLKGSGYRPNPGLSNLGAHISVMYEGETAGKLIKEDGRRISFQPLGFYKVVLDDQEYFMLEIDAPDLAKIRSKYGLAPKLNSHAFHITVGVRKYTDNAEDELAEAY